MARVVDLNYQSKLSESAPPWTFTVGEEDVEDILVVDHGARFVVKTSIEGSDLYAQTAYNGPFVRVMWVGHRESDSD